MKGSLIIIAFFVLGIVVRLQSSTFTLHLSHSSFIILCTLMFFVGISIGSDTKTLKSFRSVNPRLMMLPVMTVFGTLAGTAEAYAIKQNRNILE